MSAPEASGGPAGSVDVWGDVVGQDRAVTELRSALAQPVHAYLFVGPRGSGKRAAARAFAAELLSRGSKGDEAERHRRLALAEQHPDLVIADPEGARLSADAAREIVQEAARSPVEGDRKVIVLCELHRIEMYGAILLKSIEEPPPSTFFVILADEVPPDLVTIASRSVRIDFSPVATDVVAGRLEAEGLDREQAEIVAGAAAGDLTRARLLATDPRLAARRDAWRLVPQRLDGSGAVVMGLVDELMELIDEAQVPLDERHGREEAAIQTQIEQTGERGSGRRQVDERQRRERRRLRTDELEFGLATLVGRYRDEMADTSEPARLLAAAGAIQAAAEALDRNPNERLLLESLLFRLPALPD